MIVYAPTDSYAWDDDGLKSFLLSGNHAHIARTSEQCQSDYNLKTTEHSRRWFRQKARPFNIERAP